MMDLKYTNYQNLTKLLLGKYALSFYVTKTVLVGPKWVWSDQIDLDLTIMIWSGPKWMVRTKMNWSGPNVIHFGRTSQFGPYQFILVVTISFWSWPFHFGRDQIIMVKSKSIWSDHNYFGPTKLFWSHRRTRHKCQFDNSIHIRIVKLRVLFK